jgi:hypothetical protein
MTINTLIERYEKRMVEKKKQQEYNPNDVVEGIIVALEEVVEDLKQINTK